jgi:hypothetical protein
VGVGPFALERLEEALDLPVPAGRVGRGEDVAGAHGLEFGSNEPGAVGVAVVAHHRLWRVEPELPEVLDRAAHEAGGGLGALVVRLFA